MADGDSAVYLRRRDGPRRMARAYMMDVQRDLFGRWTLVREWGRIGSPGRVRLDPHDDALNARRAMLALLRQKQQRGYRPAGQ